MVLFHHPDDHDSVRQFKEVVKSDLMSETCELCNNMAVTLVFVITAGVNFVYADGVKFAHPLSHLGKSKKVREPYARVH